MCNDLYHSTTAINIMQFSQHSYILGGWGESEADIIRNIPAYEDKSSTHRFFFILLLYKLQVWQDMHAVNAAIGPKIQQHHPSF